MVNLPEDMDSWTQQEWHKAVEQLVAEKLKDSNYKNTILEKVIYRQMIQDAHAELSSIAYGKRLAKFNEKQKSPVECVCDKIKSLLGGK